MSVFCRMRGWTKEEIAFAKSDLLRQSWSINTSRETATVASYLVSTNLSVRDRSFTMYIYCDAGRGDGIWLRIELRKCLKYNL